MDALIWQSLEDFEAVTGVNGIKLNGSSLLPTENMTGIQSEKYSSGS